MVVNQWCHDYNINKREDLLKIQKSSFGTQPKLTKFSSEIYSIHLPTLFCKVDKVLFSFLNSNFTTENFLFCFVFRRRCMFVLNMTLHNGLL